MTAKTGSSDGGKMSTTSYSDLNSRGAVGDARRPGPPGHVADAIRGAWLESYAFTLSASISQTFIGEIPAGFRVDLQYDPDGALSFDFKSCLRLEVQNALRSAKLLTGTDWVSISRDGLATFDTRITLRAGPAMDDPDKRSVISASIRGRVDLGAARDASGQSIVTNRAEILPKWRQGFGTNTQLPLSLSVVFDVPTQGSDEQQTQVYADCRDLERGLFVAFGKASYVAGPNSPLDSIHLDFLRVPFLGRPAQDGAPDEVPDANSSGHVEGKS